MSTFRSLEHTILLSSFLTRNQEAFPVDQTILPAFQSLINSYVECSDAILSVHRLFRSVLSRFRYVNFMDPSLGNFGSLPVHLVSFTFFLSSHEDQRFFNRPIFSSPGIFRGGDFRGRKRSSRRRGCGCLRPRGCGSRRRRGCGSPRRWRWRKLLWRGRNLELMIQIYWMGLESVMGAKAVRIGPTQVEVVFRLLQFNRIVFIRR